jgi:hypothetical protein
LAASGRVVKSVPWQLVVRFQGRTTLDECRRIIDRLEEFAALLSSQWSEFSFLVTVTDPADSET